MEPDKAVVLLVDDDARTRELVHRSLGDRYRVTSAENAHDALGVLDREPVDLVLLDVMMSEINGYDVCRLIKTRTRARGEYVPVLLVTALSAQKDRNLGLEAGADDFLPKPINRQELMLRVQIFMRLRVQERLLNQRIETLKEAEGLKDDLVSLLVHDLRNPLSGIIGVLDGISCGAVDQSLRDDLGQAMSAGEHLRDALEDILQVRQSEFGMLEPRVERLDADAVLADAITAVVGMARTRRIQIARVAGAADSHLEADRKLIKRAFENLLSNAIKYSPPDAEVWARIFEVPGGISVEIADRGAGVPESFKAELFKKFGSVEAARGDVRRGFGLGLHLVSLVASAHGGRAFVRDREGGGTIFGLFLPRSHPRRQAMA